MAMPVESLFVAASSSLAVAFSAEQDFLKLLLLLLGVSSSFDFIFSDWFESLAHLSGSSSSFLKEGISKMSSVVGGISISLGAGSSDCIGSICGGEDEAGG